MFTSLAQCAKVPSWVFCVRKNEKRGKSLWKVKHESQMTNSVLVCLQYVVILIVLSGSVHPVGDILGRAALSCWSGVSVRMISGLFPFFSVFRFVSIRYVMHLSLNVCKRPVEIEPTVCLEIIKSINQREEDYWQSCRRASFLALKVGK